MSGQRSFTDTVGRLGNEPDYVNVTFWGEAANYKLYRNKADFDQQLAIITAAMKSRKPVSVVVRGTEIVSVSAQ